jgi:hypothetical protein
VPYDVPRMRLLLIFPDSALPRNVRLILVLFHFHCLSYSQEALVYKAFFFPPPGGASPCPICLPSQSQDGSIFTSYSSI